MKMEQAEGSETSAYKIQMPGNHPKERLQGFCVFLQIVILKIKISLDRSTRVPPRYDPYSILTCFKRQ